MTNTSRLPKVSDSGFISRSHRAIAPFTLHEPVDVTHAARLMGTGAIAHAGGIDVVGRLRLGAGAAAVVRLDQIDELRRIERTDSHLLIGAGVTHAQIESDQTIAETRPDLAAAWRTVGNLRIRRTGTIGGNLMAFDHTYDAAPILAAADARLIFAAPNGSTIESGVANLPRDGLLVRCEIPAEGRVIFDRTLKPVVAVAVGERTIAIGCAYPTLVVVDRSGFSADQLPEPIDDSVASAAYRRRMIEVLVRRAEGHSAEVPTT